MTEAPRERMLACPAVAPDAYRVEYPPVPPPPAPEPVETPCPIINWFPPHARASYQTASVEIPFEESSKSAIQWPVA